MATESETGDRAQLDTLDLYSEGSVGARDVHGPISPVFAGECGVERV